MIAGRRHEGGRDRTPDVRRHVAEQETRIARQKVLIDRLRKVGSPLLAEALRLLASMQDLLETMRAHVARL
jgi:hypothetical protein